MEKIFIMKYIKNLFILITFLLAWACHDSPVNESPTGEVQAHDHDHDETHTTKMFVELTNEQIKMAGIEIGQPEKRPVSAHLECSGIVEVPPQSLASVHSPIEGFATTVNHYPGEFIKKGTLMTSIKNQELIHKQKQLLEAIIQMNYLKGELDRQKTLALENATSLKEVSKMSADYQMAKTTYNGLKTELIYFGINVSELEEKGVIQEALPLYAPISGFISEVNINQGKRIQPQDLLFEIVDNAHIHLELQIFAKDLGKIQKGQLIEALIPGQDQRFKASVYLVGKTIDLETKTALVHAHFSNEPVSIHPGTFMRARIFLDKNEVWTLPEEAIVREGEQSFIFVKSGAGFEKVPVRIGQMQDGHVELMDWDPNLKESAAVKGAYYLNGSAGEEPEHTH